MEYHPLFTNQGKIMKPQNMTNKLSLLGIAGLLLTAYPNAGKAAIVAAEWTTHSSGTVNGIGFRIIGIGGGPFDAIEVDNLNSSDFAAGPLTNIEGIEYSVNKNYTIFFDSPVTDLLLYADSWRGTITSNDDPAIAYTFGSTPQILSGFTTADLADNMLTVDDQVTFFESGILRFNGTISSLSVSSDTTSGSGQFLTLALDDGTTPLAPAEVIYDWSADCIVGCTGKAFGVLRLIDTYMPGEPFRLPEFVSWEYNSSSGTLTLLKETPGPLLIFGHPPAVSGPPVATTLFRHRPDIASFTSTQMGFNDDTTPIENIPFDKGSTNCDVLALCSSIFRDQFINGSFKLRLSSLVPPEEPPVILVGSANINHIPARVDFETNQAFNQQPVIILGPLSFNGSQPATTRITQTDTTGFNLKVQEYNYLDGFHTQETTDYLAIPQGVYEQIDNLGATIIIEAGFIDLDSGPWKQVVFNADFPETPVLLTTVQTYNGKDAVIERVRMLNEGGFEARLFEEEKLNPFGHIKERLGYVAIYSSEQTANIISVNGGSAELIVNPKFKLDHLWQTISNNTQLKIEEEQSLDIETHHIMEMVNMIRVGPYLFAEDISGLGLDTSTIRKLQFQ